MFSLARSQFMSLMSVEQFGLVEAEKERDSSVTIRNETLVKIDIENCSEACRLVHIETAIQVLVALHFKNTKIVLLV